MARIIVLIFRLMPIEIIIGVIAVLAYFALSSFKDNSIAKEVLIKIVLFINSVLFVAFALVTLYSILDNHMAMIEISGCCAGICGVVATVAYICKRNFLKNRPGYRWKRIDLKKLFKQDDYTLK